MTQSRAAAPTRTRTRAQQLAIAVLALMLIALLGFYTLVTGRITDGSAKLMDGAGQASAGAEQLKDGAGQLAAGAGLADTGAGKLSSGADKVSQGVSGKLARALKNCSPVQPSSPPALSRSKLTSTKSSRPECTKWTMAPESSPPVPASSPRR
ncbi:hypothetical protein AHiyo4_29770 [Arthrobacter sp. Hiyo4]|nr:hypothetical protein AHiyo4_29770 [Arthrobacter sp. Hiyo4]